MMTEYRATPKQVSMSSYTPIITEPDEETSKLVYDVEKAEMAKPSKAALVALMPLAGPVTNPKLGKTHAKQVLLNEAWSGHTDYMIVFYPHTFEVPIVTIWAKGTDGSWYPWKIVGLEQNIAENYLFAAHYSSLLMFKGNSIAIGSTVLNGQFTTVYTKTKPDLRNLTMSDLTRLRDEDSSVVANESIIQGAVIVPEIPTTDSLRGIWEGNSTVRTITEGQVSKNYFYDYYDSGPSNSVEFVANPSTPGFYLFDTNRGVLPYELIGNTEITMDMEVATTSAIPSSTLNNHFYTISIYYRSGIDTFTQEDFSTGCGNGPNVIPSPLGKTSKVRHTTRKIHVSEYDGTLTKKPKKDQFKVDLTSLTLKDCEEKKFEKKVKEEGKIEEEGEYESEPELITKPKTKTTTMATSMYVFNGGCKFTVYTPFPIERITVKAVAIEPITQFVADVFMNAHIQLKNWSCVNDGPMMPVALTIIEGTDSTQTIRINGFFNVNLVPKETTIPDIKLSYDPAVSILDVDWAKRLSANRMIKNIYTQPEYYKLVTSGALYEIAFRENHQGMAASFGSRIKDIINKAISGGIRVGDMVSRHGPQFMSGVGIMTKILEALQRGDAKDVATLVPQIYKMFNKSGVGLASSEPTEDLKQSLDDALNTKEEKKKKHLVAKLIPMDTSLYPKDDPKLPQYDEDDIDAPKKMRLFLYKNYGNPVDIKRLRTNKNLVKCTCGNRNLETLHRPDIAMSGVFKFSKTKTKLLRKMLNTPAYYSDEDVNNVVNVYPCQFWEIYLASNEVLPHVIKKILMESPYSVNPKTVLKFGVTMAHFMRVYDEFTGTFTALYKERNIEPTMAQIPEDENGNSGGYAASQVAMKFTDKLEEIPELEISEYGEVLQQQKEYMEYFDLLQGNYIQFFPIVYKENKQPTAVIGAVTVTQLPLNYRVTINRSEGVTSYSKNATKPNYRKLEGSVNQFIDANLLDFGPLFDILPDTCYVTLVSTLHERLVPIKGESWCMAATISAMAIQQRAPGYQVAYSGSLIINDKIGTVYGPAEFIREKSQIMFEKYGLYTLACWIERDFIFGPVTTGQYLYHCISPNAIAWWHSTVAFIGVSNFDITKQEIELTEEEIEQIAKLPNTENIILGIKGKGKNSNMRSMSQSARAGKALLDKYNEEGVEVPAKMAEALERLKNELPDAYKLYREKTSGEPWVERKSKGKTKKVPNVMTQKILDHLDKTLVEYENRRRRKEVNRTLTSSQKGASLAPLKPLLTNKGKLGGNQVASYLNAAFKEKYDMLNTPKAWAYIKKHPSSISIVDSENKEYQEGSEGLPFIHPFNLTSANFGWTRNVFEYFYPELLRQGPVVMQTRMRTPRYPPQAQQFQGYPEQYRGPPPAQYVQQYPQAYPVMPQQYAVAPSFQPLVTAPPPYVPRRAQFVSSPPVGSPMAPPQRGRSRPALERKTEFRQEQPTSQPGPRSGQVPVTQEQYPEAYEEQVTTFADGTPFESAPPKQVVDAFLT